MKDVEYRMCRFFPNLQDHENFTDFAVVCANDESCALIGYNLSELGLQDTHPITEVVFGNTFEMMWRRILETRDRDDPSSGHDLIRNLVNESPSNVVFTEIAQVPTIQDVVEAASQLVKAKILPSMRPQPIEPMPRKIGQRRRDWWDAPRRFERQTLLTEAFSRR